MMRYRLMLIFVLSGLAVLPADSISSWFSSSFYDVRVVLKRFSSCVEGRAPLKGINHTETDYLVNSINTFLDQGQYTSDQLHDVNRLMNTICMPGNQGSYPVSFYLNTSRFTGDGNYTSSNSTLAKANRCKAIDLVLDDLFDMFRRAALNKTMTLDFGAPRYFENMNRDHHYSMTDLINTLWIKSETTVDHVCNITNAIKNHTAQLISQSGPENRSQQQASAMTNWFSFINRVLDPVLGLQRRLYWEGSNVLESAQERYIQLRGALGGFISRTRDRIGSPFRASNSTTSSSNNLTTSSVNTTVNSSANSRITAQSIPANLPQAATVNQARR